MKIDKRKKLLNNLKDNGLENERKNNRSERSGLVKIKQSQIRKLAQKLAECENEKEAEKIEQAIEQKEIEIQEYIAKNVSDFE